MSAEERLVTEVPSSLKKLARLVVRGFYSIEDALIVDMLVRNPCMKEDDICELLKFERKMLRARISTLRNDKFIQVRLKMETGSDGKAQKVNYYFINYKTFVNVVKYKLDLMRKRMETEERDATSRASFKCPSCLKTFTDLEADQLFDMRTGEFRCTYCREIVEEDQSALPKKDSRLLLAKFNEQLEPLYILLREVEGIKLAPEILEPEPIDINTIRGIDMRKPSSLRGPNEQWSGEATRMSGFMVEDTRVDVTIGDESPDDSASNHRKERPIWMMESTVINADGSQPDGVNTQYDSTICRLCAASNGNEHLFVSETGEPDLSSLVNRYLPLKIHDDGKLPRTICPGCNIQLEATAQFFELLVAGQRKIRELWKHQVEKQRKAERFRGKKENAEFEAEGTEMDSTAQYNEDEQYEQQIIIKIMPDGSMYAVEHEMSLQMEGLTKPKRKRGRPPKVNAEDDSVATKENPAEAGSQGEEDKQEEEEEVDGDGRRRRKRKVPKRYLEAVQGKELERIFKEEGVIDEEDNNSQIFDGPADLLKSSNQEDGQEEVIGHLETEEGTDLGEVVTVNRGRSKSKWRRRKNKFTCQLCGRGFLQRSKYIVHKSFHMGIKHECTQCKKLFESKESLTLHQETTKHNSNHTEENIEVQKSQKSHETHNVEQTTSTVTPEIAKDSRKAIYTCEKCNKQFGLKQEYELHMRVVHEQQKFTCNTCKKSFTNESDLKTHMTTHGKTKYNYPCDICGKVLNHPSSVLYHKEAEHNNGRRFVCNKCNKSFKHKQLLQRHQLVHSDNRPHVCKSCNASFKTKANLINHQSTHTGQKKYNCELCKQQFAHKTSLTLHYRWHSGQKPFKCKECGKSFSQNGNLQEHIRIHTGEKPYSCDFCGRKFTTSSQFKLHVKRHTGERPWKCEFCAKTFLHKDTWKCHVRRHKGERPFQCSTCKRSFTEQWALKKHIRLHTGEKPYSCDVCNKAFADCSNLTKHKKVHREDKMPPTNKSEGSSIGQVWQILPNSVRQVDERTFSNQIIATDETSNDGIQQIIYVSYQDPSDSNERTFHMIDANKNKDEIVASVNSLSRLDMENNEIIGDRIMSNAASSNDDQSEIELTEPDLQLQITDEHGNPIPLTIQEARQLLSQGHFVSQFNDNQIMRLHPGMFATQQLQALNIHVDEDTMEETGIIVRPNTHKNIEALSAIQADADAIVQALEDEDTDATAVATINQLGNIEQTEFVNGEQTIEFVTQDGQKLRVLTSQLASEYVTIA